MTKMIQESELRAIWKNSGYGGADNMDIDVYGKTVKVSQMYEFLPLSVKHIMELAKLFGTEKFDINQTAAEMVRTYGEIAQKFA